MEQIKIKQPLSITQKPIVTINHLYHYFGKKSLRKPILLDINLNLKPKETVILNWSIGVGKDNLTNSNRWIAICSSRKS